MRVCIWAEQAEKKERQAREELERLKASLDEKRHQQEEISKKQLPARVKELQASQTRLNELQRTLPKLDTEVRLYSTLVLYSLSSVAPLFSSPL